MTSAQKKTHRCRICGVETLSSKACPKCGRRSTLIPIDEADTETEAHSAQETRRGLKNEGERKVSVGQKSPKKLWGLVAALLAVIAAAIFGLTVSFTSTERKNDKSKHEGASSTQTNHAGNSPHSRSREIRIESRTTATSKTRSSICGRGYCLVLTQVGKSPFLDVEKTTQNTPSSPKTNGSKTNHNTAGAHSTKNSSPQIITKHCFLLKKTPTPVRWWYIPASHEMEATQRDGTKKTIFKLTSKGVRLPGKKSLKLGDGVKILPNSAPDLLGSRLFYVGRTFHGFALASPPRLTGFLKTQMLLMALTATALMPFPPKQDSKTWVDRRPLPPIMKLGEPLLPLQWTRIKNSKPARYSIRVPKKDNPKKSKTSVPQKRQNTKASKIRLNGTTLLDLSGMTKKSSFFYQRSAYKSQGLAEMKGHIELTAKKQICITH